MKFIVAIFTLVLLSSAVANDQLTFSKFMASNYQTMIDELPEGSYFTKVEVIFQYNMNDEVTATVPVLLAIREGIQAPSKMEDCSENTESVACQIAMSVFRWVDAYQPPMGQFLVTMRLGTTTKEASIRYNSKMMR